MNSDDDYTFDIGPEVVFRLGDELISDELQALVELVKNSYDASAENVEISIETETPDSNYAGWVEVLDDGDGMDRNDLIEGWLLISVSGKRRMKERGETNRLGRTPLGDKGLGRLGVLRLGNMIEIRTRPRNRAEEHILRFSRRDFEGEARLSDVQAYHEVRKLSETSGGELSPDRPFDDDVTCSPLAGTQGTVIRVSNITDVGAWKDQSRIQQEMLALVSPYRAISDFRISLHIDRSLGKPGIDVGDLSDARMELAFGRWKFSFDRGQLKANGRYKLDGIKPSQSNERLMVVWNDHVLPDRGAELRRRLKKGKFSDFTVRPGDGHWWISIDLSFDVNDLGASKSDRKRAQEHTADSANQWADPGPFSGELSVFGRRGQQLEIDGQEVFGSQSDFSAWINAVQGIHIYRDGFGVRTPRDFLDLGSAFTSASSFRALRPANTVGYVAISAAENAQLEETTDREGFVENAPYLTFRSLLLAVADRASVVQVGAGREIESWADELNVEPPHAPSNKAAEAAKRLGDLESESSKAQTEAASIRRELGEIRHSPEAKDTRVAKALERASDYLNRLPDLLSKSQTIRADLEEVASSTEDLERQRDQLRIQLQEAYQTVGLGIIAETVAHEMTNITGRLQARADAVAPDLKGREQRPGKVLLAEARDAVRSIRLQLKHLEPQLRYQRQRRKTVSMREEVDQIVAYHSPRLEPEGIIMKILGRDFSAQINSGRFQQALDNLVLNSQFWLGQTDQPAKEITVRLERPLITFEDNGPGVDPSLANSIFQPFVSGRPGDDGRGLGLFITEQVLREDDVRIFLGPASDDGRRRQFVLDFTEAIEGGISNARKGSTGSS